MLDCRNGAKKRFKILTDGATGHALRSVIDAVADTRRNVKVVGEGKIARDEVAEQRRKSVAHLSKDQIGTIDF